MCVVSVLQPQLRPWVAVSLTSTWLAGAIGAHQRDSPWTKIPVRMLWSLYCLGDQQAKIGPYRFIEANDMDNDKKRRARLSDMHGLLRPVRDHLEHKGKWVPSPSIDQVNEMWAAGAKVIDVAARTEGQRHRRKGQMAWTSHLNEYRKRVRSGAGGPGGDDGSGDEGDAAAEAGAAVRRRQSASRRRHEL